ncbi:MAG: 3-phosphoshikimate 1-carboxyvinyltransferase [Ruminococcus sp.]|nr:3-phosphoshikimate 1-carboxyvinyltransferase [Ruminococcus sp.]
MDILIKPSVLKGRLDVPASKSCAHRAVICASLADGISKISGITMSKDIEATINAMTALGAEFDIVDNVIYVEGIKTPHKFAHIDCNESGSTLRFIIPIAAALGVDALFSGKGRLPQRPIDIYKRELSKHNIEFLTENMPYEIEGRLTGGIYEVEGNVSSQFITGLLFALPLAESDSEIIMTSHLESRPYVDITIDILKRFGISVEETENSFKIKGGQKYTPHDECVEGDYSQAAFFYVANALGSKVEMCNLKPDSVQGDKKIIELINSAISNGKIMGYKANCSDIPDLVPILSVLGAYGSESSLIYNAERLRIKESDRLTACAEMLNKLGGNVTVTSDGLDIKPVMELHGGIIDSFGDHRIVMAAAVAGLCCNGEVIIKGAEAVTKSYPDFFNDYKMLGGVADVINMEQ